MKFTTVGERERLSGPSLRQNADNLERPSGERELRVAIQLDLPVRGEHSEQKGLSVLLYAAQPDFVAGMADDSERLRKRAATLENRRLRF